jgi:hypothetical protein
VRYYWYIAIFIGKYESKLLDVTGILVKPLQFGVSYLGQPRLGWDSSKLMQGTQAKAHGGLSQKCPKRYEKKVDRKDTETEIIRDINLRYSEIYRVYIEIRDLFLWRCMRCIF